MSKNWFALCNIELEWFNRKETNLQRQQIKLKTTCNAVFIWVKVFQWNRCNMFYNSTNKVNKYKLISKISL